MVPVSRAQRSTWRLDSPVPFGPTLVPKDFGVKKGPKSLPTLSAPPMETAQGQPRAGDGGLVSRPSPPGRHVESRARKQLWPAGLHGVF